LKDTVKLLKWVTGALEALLGIPVLGGTIVVSLLWLPLLFMLVLHIVTLVLAKKANMSANGNVLGIVTSCLAWIPFVGMIMHILSAIFIMIDAARKEETY
jgi:hypothetical protein